jgi:hypothetical protein
MSDEFMKDYKRDTSRAMASRIKMLEEALREIVRKRKLDATAAASMQAIAREALK